MSFKFLSFISVWVILVSSVCCGANLPQAADTVSLANGGIVVPDSVQYSAANGYFTVFCGTTSSGIGANFFAPCSKNGSTTQYAPTNGKTFRVSAVCSKSGSANGSFQLVQDKGAHIAFTFAGTALTTGVYQSGVASVGAMAAAGTAWALNCEQVSFDFVGVASFGDVGIQNTAGASQTIAVWLIGKEI